MPRLWILPLLVLPGCAAPTPWQPAGREQPWDTRPLTWLLARQSSDGSWGEGASPVEGLPIGRIGVTALVLNTVMGYQYSQLSREPAHGYQVGRIVQSGLDWLIRQMEPDGHFRREVPGGFEHLLGAVALIENYSGTSDKTVVGPATTALAAVMNARRADGTWGSSECTLMAMLAMEGARMADLKYDAKALQETLRILDEESRVKPDRYNAIAPGILHYRGPRELRRASLGWVITRAPDALRPDYPGWLFGSYVVYSVCMNPDPEWRRWTQAMEEAIEANVGSDGGWAGPTRDASIVRTAIVGLCHVMYQGSRKWEWKNVFSEKK